MNQHEKIRIIEVLLKKGVRPRARGVNYDFQLATLFQTPVTDV
jgi:hypothetical protein